MVVTRTTPPELYEDLLKDFQDKLDHEYKIFNMVIEFVHQDAYGASTGLIRDQLALAHAARLNSHIASFMTLITKYDLSKSGIY